MRVLLIHNPEAGGENQPSCDDLVRLIRDAGHSAIYQSTKHGDWHAVLDEPTDLVAVAGGDGAVGLVTKRLVGKKVPVTILPMGTANNIALTLNLKNRPFDRLIAGWSSAPRVKLDVGVANGPWGSKYFIEGVGAGAFTDTMAKLDARKNADFAHHEDTKKKVDTALHILKLRLEASPSVHLKLELDGHDFTGDYALLEAMNIRSIGPNLRLAPNADPGDGMLDIVLVTEAEKEQLNRYLAEQIADKQSAPDLTVHRGRHLRIQCDEMRVHLDDEIWPSHGEHPPYSPMIIEVSLHPESLELLAPR